MNFNFSFEEFAKKNLFLCPNLNFNLNQHKIPFDSSFKMFLKDSNFDIPACSFSFSQTDSRESEEFMTFVFKNYAYELTD
jgi:hypothetical protein